MEARDAPDVPAPDAVPNAGPRPCRYCVTGLRDPLAAPGLKGRHPFGKGRRSDKRSNRRCCERQTQTGGNGSAYARASAALKCAMPQCLAQRYCVTLEVLQLAVDMGGRPHKPLRQVFEALLEDLMWTSTSRAA
jgi:hypothetical protein